MPDIDPELRAWAERMSWGEDGEVIPLIRVKHIFRVAEAAWNERGAVDAARRVRENEALLRVAEAAKVWREAQDAAAAEILVGVDDGDFLRRRDAKEGAEELLRDALAALEAER